LASKPLAGVAGLFVAAVTGREAFSHAHRAAAALQPIEMKREQTSRDSPIPKGPVRRRLRGECANILIRLKDRSASRRGERFRSRRVGENPGAAGIELGKSASGDPGGLLRVIQRVV
jgi:hypothetical protein